MSRLSQVRALLRQHIVVNEPFSAPRAKQIAQLASDWFIEYKEWEKADRFLAAVRDKRMCISQRGTDTVIGAGNRSNPAHLGVKDQDKQGGTTQKILYKTLSYRTGVDSLKERLDPANFGSSPQGEEITRLKYKLGLHDLSASLMNPDKPTIKEQARWELDPIGSKSKWPLVFMPLPKQKDLVVFNLLNLLHKEWRTAGHLDLAETVARIRRRMTRVKFAQDSDMGAGLINANPAGSGDPNLAKFRYGMADVQGKEGTTLTVYIKGISLVRQAKALEYQSILATQTSSSNEIVVAFRQHDSPRFPMIGLWNGNGVDLEGGPTGIQGNFIPNNWASTVEL
ncbi:hypothetical protein WKW79_23545 [Variovorax robiniae]|uniref:Uncharacterized protein n=1 Tax=Variovorax robiniae TaxID=1836199 RepID=A0ABU8XCU6_9BURK